jgi:hypothetical protein
VKNYLDPYAFWNFRSNVKCAGCNAIWHVEIVRGQLIGEPTEASGTDYALPGFAETSDYKPITGPGKTRPAPRPRPDIVGKPKPVTKSIRGKPVSGRPLKLEELIGSRARFIDE